MDMGILKSALDESVAEMTEKISHNFSDRRGRNLARQYIIGLMSSAERKNGWQLAEALGQGTPYAIQQFLYRGGWEPDDLRDDLRDYVKDALGEQQGVLIVDETGFLKKGKKSAGVIRQYSGTAGRIENCQVGVFLTYSSSKGFTAIDRELYLPKEWTEDEPRRKEAGIPDNTEFKTKPQMALEMLKSAYNADMPFSWVTADSVYGDYRDIGMWLESVQKGYVMAVSGKAYVWSGFTQLRISAVLENLPDDGWLRLSAGEGSKGERLYDWLLTPLNNPPQDGFKRSLLVRRSITKPSESTSSVREDKIKEDKTKSENLRAFICFYPESAHMEELVKIAGIRWTIEQSFEEAKGEVGLDQYEVRSYNGWYKHITLSCLALALLALLKIRAAGPDFQAAVDADTGVPGSMVSGNAVSWSMDAFKKGRGL